MDTALRALNRFGLGARPGERARITNPRAWLRNQLEGPVPRPAMAGGRPERVGELITGLRRARTPEERQPFAREIPRIRVADAAAVLEQRVTTDRPFVERLVAFWSNHLCVSADKGPPLAALAGLYERDAIRPHVLGRFEDMVLASAQHPAMLFYLDNAQSIGPTSPGARLMARGGASRGLNENYARELLELHTLGVDGGYTQQDVLELARLLTGWSVAGAGEPARLQRMAPADGSDTLRFVFRQPLHEPGSKVVLGERYGTGVAEGERAVRMLCRHPATALFVARRLVTHFVSDTPSDTAVTGIARVFSETRGDLRAVSLALVDLDEAWSADAVKFRTPQDWLVAVLRALGVRQVDERMALMLRQLRHTMWSPAAPKGFGDTVQEWADPDSLMNRAELARTLARRAAPRGVAPHTLLDVADVADDTLRMLLDDASIPADERIALALAGPAFQWR